MIVRKVLAVIAGIACVLVVFLLGMWMGGDTTVNRIEPAPCNERRVTSHEIQDKNGTTVIRDINECRGTP